MDIIHFSVIWYLVIQPVDSMTQPHGERIYFDQASRCHQSAIVLNSVHAKTGRSGESIVIEGYVDTDLNKKSLLNLDEVWTILGKSGKVRCYSENIWGSTYE